MVKWMIFSYQNGVIMESLLLCKYQKKKKKKNVNRIQTIWQNTYKSKTAQTSIIYNIVEHIPRHRPLEMAETVIIFCLFHK